MSLPVPLRAFTAENKLPPGCAEITVLLFVIAHIFPAANLLLELFGLPGLVIDGLNEAGLPIILQIQVVIQTLVARIRHNIPVLFPVLLFQPA